MAREKPSGPQVLARRVGKKNFNEIRSLAFSISRRSSDLDEVLARTASVLIRTVKYAAHASYIKSVENRPAAYCAAPRRIEVMRRYLANPELSSVEFATRGFFDLMGRLGLPAGGYNFAMFAESLNPLPFSELSIATADLPPKEALARTLDLRKSSAARKIRAEWARRLWGRTNSSAEGLGQSVTHSIIRGNVTLYQYVATPEPLASTHHEPPKQSAEYGRPRQNIPGNRGSQRLPRYRRDPIAGA